MPRVVVIEDENTVREVVQFHLSRAGLDVISFAEPESAWQHLPQADFLVLDWMLPQVSGIELLGRIRSTPEIAHLPILMLTARASEKDKVEGLNTGADDYLTKPFSAAELVARVKALLRRSKKDDGYVISRGGLVLDTQAATATLRGVPLHLTRREYDLLLFLVQNPMRVYSRSELLDKVWGTAFLGGERTVDQHITQLRAHLQDDVQEPQFIETVRGKGYRMKA